MRMCVCTGDPVVTADTCRSLAPGMSGDDVMVCRSLNSKPTTASPNLASGLPTSLQARVGMRMITRRTTAHPEVSLARPPPGRHVVPDQPDGRSCLHVLWAASRHGVCPWRAHSPTHAASATATWPSGNEPLSHDRAADVPGRTHPQRRCGSACRQRCARRRASAIFPWQHGPAQAPPLTAHRSGA